MLNNRMNGDLLEDLADYQMLLESEGINKLTSEIEREVVVLGDAGDVFLKLFDNDGDLIYSTDLTDWKGLVTDKTILEKVTRSASVSTPLIEIIKVPDREFPARVVVGRIDPHTVLQLGESLEEKEEILGLLLNTYTVIFCLIIPLVSMLCWFVARQAVRVIEEVSQADLDFQKGEFDRHVSVNAFGNEIQQLANTFNVMAE
jgi:methyl-accepting chemotaxis protein